MAKPKNVYLSRIKPRIEAEQKKPGLAAVLRRIQDDRLKRTARPSAPRFADWDASGEPVMGLLPGTVTVFWASKKSGAVARIEDAVRSGDRAALQALHGKLFGKADRRPVLTLKRAADMLMREPVYCDLRCGGATLAEGLAPFGASCGSLIFPYSGGPLSASDFSLMEWAKGADTPGLDVLAVRCMPRLSATERLALQAAPSGLAELHVGRSIAAVNVTTAVTVVVIVTINTFTINCAGVVADELRDVAVAKGGPASAQELVRRRLNILQERGLA
jgi:hypothetical protein